MNDQFNFHYNRGNSATASPSSKLFIIFFGLVDIALLVREGPVETDLLEKMALRYEEILEQVCSHMVFSISQSTSFLRTGMLTNELALRAQRTATPAHIGPTN